MKKKIALVLALAIIASCLCILLTGCGADNTLIGTWEAEGNFFTFKSDGKYITVNEDGVIWQRDYKIIGKDLVELSSEIYKGLFKYVIEGDILLLYEYDDPTFAVKATKKK